LVAALACRGGSKHNADTTLADGTPPSATQPATSPTATITPRDLASEIGVAADLPTNDPLDLSARYGRTNGRAPASKPFGGEPAAGSKRDFYVARLSGAALSHKEPPAIDTITATLLATSDHAYFYVDDAVGGDATAFRSAAEQFDATVWPAVTGVFGQPASPGVDGDPRIIVLQADLGGGAGGYYSGDDAYLRSVRRYSNEAEMVYIDRTLKPGGAAFNVVLAHELQHLIHANNDRDEEAWVNEGLSEDASSLVGGALSSVRSFAARPETQLNAWDSLGSAPHYGAGAAFFRYLATRFGGDRVYGAIARAPHDGTAGVDEALAALGNGDVDFTRAFTDWMASNALDVADGPYGNGGHPLDVVIDRELLQGDAFDEQAHQFGTDFYRLPSLDGGDYVVEFHGRTDVGVLPADALANGPVLWANAEDDIDTRLTFDLDLAGTEAPALTFRTWFDIEHWYDWGYVSISTDGGTTWAALSGAHTEADDPVGAAYGPGYSGTSGRGDAPAWLDERIDLAPYAGKAIKLRFEYVTDGGTHGAGWAVRDIALMSASGAIALPQPELEGWVLVDRPLRQSYAVRLIATRDGQPVVQDVPLDASNAGELRFSSAGLRDVVLAIAGTTIGTEELAPYSLTLVRP